MLPNRTDLPRRKRDARRFVTSAAIGFALTLLVAVVALSSGLLPRFALGAGLSVDMASMLLFLPLCALVLAVLVEVVRGISDPAPLPRQAESRFAPWRPGHGEG